MNKPGFGARHPALASLLTHYQPAGSHDVAWAGGTLPLRISAYTKPAPLPEEIVTSVRCMVLVDGLVIFCENPDGSHPWPGGRRLPGESYLETAIREVQEETGWLIQPDSATELGWLHLTHLSPQLSDNIYPYPDFLQVVFYAKASERTSGPDAQWTDVDGYETRSHLVTLEEAMRATSNDLLARAFLELLGEKLATGEIA